MKLTEQDYKRIIAAIELTLEYFDTIEKDGRHVHPSAKRSYIRTREKIEKALIEKTVK